MKHTIGTLLSRVLNFGETVIRGVLFSRLQLWKKGIKFLDLSVLNFILFFEMTLNLFKLLDKLDSAKRIHFKK